MCLGIPGKVVSIYENKNVLMGKVTFGALTKDICLSMVPDVHIGQFVIVHVGFALSVIDEQAAEQAIQLLKEAA